ncbi:MAG TPA: hypothetical protein VGM31_09660 [Puia sp.]
MHDPKFEMEVQKKLEELSFSPSEAVWTRVERAVNEKRRRRVPFFWFFLLPSLGLAGAGMIYFSKHRTTPDVQIVQRVTDGRPLAGTAIPSEKQVAPDRQAASNRQAASEKQAASDRQAASNRQVALGRHAAPERRAASDRQVVSGRQAAPDKQLPSDRDRPSNVQPKPVVAATTEATAAATTSPEPSAPTLNPTANKEMSYAAVQAPGAFHYPFAAPAASRLATSSIAAASKSPINLKPKYSWEMGFAGGIGVSTLNKSFLEQPAVMASDVPALSSPTPVNAAYSNSKSPTSGVRPDLSYWAGIVAQRPLSRMVSLSLGLDLHYYSTSMQIGQAVYNDPSSFYQASTLLTQQAATGARSTVYPYYSIGNDDVFVNRYYFLELPASILWQVNHSRRLPLFWENGLSLTYMVSTNSLYFNAKTGVFYKDQGTMANKAQLNLSTALLVGLPIRNMRLQAGPQLQYGLTSLQHQSSIGQHMFYGGIRIVLLPGKSKK